MKKTTYDLLVIGSGAAGSSAVTTAAREMKGKRIALIEQGRLGGTCLNYGCDPTKTLLYAAHLLSDAWHADRYGLRIPEVADNWSETMRWVHSVMHQLRGGTVDEARQQLTKQGIEVIAGKARFISPHEVEVTGGDGQEKRTLNAERILIATGSETVVPPIEGLQEAGFITNVEAVSLSSLPRRLAIAGGGAIGIEFAQLFARFGVSVTVIERSQHILDTEDQELAEELGQILIGEGIRLITGAELTRVQRENGYKQLTYRGDQQAEEMLEADEVLMAVGRQGAFADLNLEAAGVKTTKKGIQVDATLRTSAPHIWAAGDVASPYQFTHIASEQGKLAARNAFATNPRSFDDRVIPWAIFTYPALAHVGKTEEELRQNGTGYRVLRAVFKENERATTEGKREGQVKLLVDGHGYILGGHILGKRADDLIAPVILAMHAQLPVQALADTMMPYPTMVEAVRLAAQQYKE